MAKKYFIMITEDMYGATACRRIECPVASEFVLKKMWKHYCKMYQHMDSFGVYAMVESEDPFDMYVEDLSMGWCYQEMEHAAMAGAIPFCC